MNNLEEAILKSYSSKTSIVKLLFLVFALTMLNSCSTYRANRLKNKSYKNWKSFQWTETKRSTDKDTVDWIIYSRKIKGTNLLEYKIEAEIATSSEGCVAAFRKDHYQQPTKKLQRIQAFRGSWDFIKDAKNKTKAVNVVQFDSKGMPEFLIRPMVTNFLIKGLENLRETNSNKNFK